MKRVIKMSKAGIAAFVLGVLLAGCGGGSADTATTSSSSSSSSPGSEGGNVHYAPVAVLSWSAPSTRVNGDGIKMGELDKYVIRYGQDKDNLNQTIVVDDASSKANMSYTVDGLGTGSWYFTIQVQDTEGLVSEPSEVVSKQIQA
jgi:hypothetical protein